MVKKFLSIAFLPALTLLATAQNAPAKNDLTIAATLGYNSFATVEAQNGLLKEYSAVAPNTNWASKKLMTGIEFGWFATPGFKITLGGGVNYSENPGYDEIPGTVSSDSEDSFGEIPTYRSIDQSRTLCYDGRLALDFYLKTSIESLKLILGAHGGFAHCIDEKKFLEANALGKSLAEAYTIKGGAAFGAEYFIARGFYVGAQVDFGSFTYGKVSYRPQEGLSSLKADNYNFSFLSAPTIKVGFKF